MLLRAKFKQETEKRVSTNPFHYSLLKSTTSVKNIKSHCINYFTKANIFKQNNSYIRHVGSKNLITKVDTLLHIVVIAVSAKIR
ncbi:hypothetical protein Hanom_Chr03g00256751 [Helianthus anomalus]